MSFKNIGLAFIILTLVSALIERPFFGGVDENGVLLESFFLLWAWGSAFIGTTLLGVALMVRVRRQVNQTTHH